MELLKPLILTKKTDKIYFHLPTKNIELKQP